MRPLAWLPFALLAVPPAGASADDLIGADRPGLANSSATVGRGHLQVEAGLYRDRDDLDVDGFATPVLLRFGVTDAFELRAESDGREWAHSPHTEPEHGWAPVSAGFKCRFTTEDGARPAVGLIARVFPASGSGVYRSQRATGDAVLAADKGFGEHWSVNPNVGVAWLDAERGRYAAALAALTVQYSFRPSLGAFVDGSWQSPEVPHESPVEMLDLGGAWILGRDTQLDLSLGWGAGGLSVPRWFWSAGVSRRF